MICGLSLAGITSAPAFAQDDSTDVEAVVITGSRLKQQDFTATSPVTTIGSENIEMTGTLTVDTLLNELPQIVPGNTRTSNNAGGEDFATVDLRGLGPSRTLVLVNGERVPASSTTGVVDLNTIPASLISRIEVVTGGASAVYGSDAISGVVNFILKEDYEGGEMTASYGSNFDGVAPEFEINGLFGGNFANGRGNLTAYVSYYNRKKAGTDEVDWDAANSAAVMQTLTGDFVAVRHAADAIAIGGTFPFGGGGSGTPAWGWIARNTANPFNAAMLNTNPLTAPRFALQNTDCNAATAGANYTGGNLSFNDAGRLTPRFTAGYCAIPDRSAGSSRYNFAPDNLLILPAERINLTTIGHYDLTDTITAKVQLNYVNSTSEVQLAATPATGLSITMTPAMQTVIAAHPDLAFALSTRPMSLANFTMDRRMNEVGTRNAYYENNAFSMLTTVDGKLGDTWTWSATASFGRSDFSNRAINSVNKTALTQGLAGCQTSAGAPLPGALPGCVPLDIFGPGTLTDAMTSFLRVNTFEKNTIEESRLAAFASGDLFELPAGPVSFVVGGEYRDSSAQKVIDNEQRTGNIFGFNAIQDQGGSIDVYEAYAEIGVPLVKEVPFFNYLGLEAGYRLSDYSSVGTVDTYKVGGKWAPVEWLSFRAMYNVATRAPNVFELFQNGDQGFPSYADPCNNTVARTPAVLALCNALNPGFVGGYATFTQNNAQVEAFAFGNPNLKPE